MSIYGTFLLKALLLLNEQPLINQDIILADRTTGNVIQVGVTDAQGYATFQVAENNAEKLGLIARVENNSLAVLKFLPLSAHHDTTVTLRIQSDVLKEIRVVAQSVTGFPDSLRVMLSADSAQGIPRNMNAAFLARRTGHESFCDFIFYLHPGDTLRLEVAPGEYRISGDAIDRENETNIFRTTSDYVATAARYGDLPLEGNKYAGFHFVPSANRVLVMQLEIKN